MSDFEVSNEKEVIIPSNLLEFREAVIQLMPESVLLGINSHVDKIAGYNPSRDANSIFTRAKDQDMKREMLMAQPFSEKDVEDLNIFLNKRVNAILLEDPNDEMIKGIQTKRFRFDQAEGLRVDEAKE